MEAIRFSETSILTTATRRYIPEDGILHSHLCGILKLYILCILSTMGICGCRLGIRINSE
jgi:hypothetical protein